MKKRIRSVNFTFKETELLISLVESQIDIVDNKKCDTVSLNEKENAWKFIETEFNCLNANGDVMRDAKCLRSKFDSLKRDLRKKERDIDSQRFNIGSYCGKNYNTTKALTPLEKKIKDMIGPTVEIEKDDNLTLTDSDQEDVKDFILDLPTINLIEDVPPKNEPMDDIEVEEILLQEQTANVSNYCNSVAVETTSTTNTFESKLQPKIASPVELRSKHPAPFINKVKKRKLAEDKLTKTNIEIAMLQKRLIAQEIEKELAQTKIFQEELEHKKQIQELERQHLLLKIELTRNELERAKNC